MPDDLLTICQHVSDKIQIESPTSIIGSSNEVSRHLRAAARDEIYHLVRRPEDGWEALNREHTFSVMITGSATATTANKLEASGATFQTDTVSVGDNVKNTTDDTTTTVTAIDSETILSLADDIFASGEVYEVYRQEHALPTGFSHFLDDTLWDRSRFWEMRGPLTRSEWQKYKSSVLGDTVTNRIRYQLRSNAATTNPEVRFTLDPPPAEDHDLVFEYVLNGAVKKTDGTLVENWVADTDETILDQWILELGIAWRSLKALGLPYDEELNEYEAQADAAIGRDGGGRILSLARAPQTALLTTCNVPDTGFGS